MIIASGGAYPWSHLFASGEQGAAYDPSNLSSMFQDSAGTVAVTAVGQPVRRINDLSGNGNDLYAPSDSARPLLAQSGAYYYLDFDGVDDRMRTSGNVNMTAFHNSTMWLGIASKTDAINFLFSFDSAGVAVGATAFFHFDLLRRAAASGESGNVVNSNYSLPGFGRNPEVDIAAVNFGGLSTPATAIRQWNNGVEQAVSNSGLSANNTMGNYPIILCENPANGTVAPAKFFRCVFRASTSATSDADVLKVSDWINKNVGAY